MKYHLVLLCLAAISALLASTAYSVKVSGIYSGDVATKTVYIDKKEFVLKCNVTDNTDGKTLQWKRGGTPLTDQFKGRNKTEHKGTVYSLTVTEATNDDIGNYTCEVGGESIDFQVVTRVFVKVESYINVVEGESLKIRCDTRGTPPPKLSWTYVNDTFNATYEDSTEKVSLSPFNNVENGELQIDNIQKYDRGVYTCIGRPAVAVDSDVEVELVKASCTVRVKDKYAALWPFLGICAEVFVLCLIIFIYEKKRNKTELDESDTDQSPDQKNTPDHGKESNLRHRQ